MVPIKSDELWAQWSRHAWSAHYLFAGAEDFLIDQACENLARHWLGDDRRDIRIERFDADSHKTSEIIQAVQTEPLFGGARVVRIENSSEFSAADQKSVVALLSRLAPDTHVIFIWGKDWRRDDAHVPLVEALGQVGQVVVFWPLFPDQAQRWLLQRAKHYQKSMTPA